MNWQEILIILLPLLSLMAWVYNQIEKKFNDRFNYLKNEINYIKLDISIIKDRLSRIEGQSIVPLKYWAPSIFEKTKEEEKK